MKPIRTIEKVFESSGYPCAVIHDDVIGFRCGYVGVDQSHPLYGKCHSIFSDFIQVHGGVTFSGPSILVKTETPTWWIGFDCAHAFDKCDIYDKMPFFHEPEDGWTKKSVEYCMNQCVGMAKQLRKMTYKSIENGSHKAKA